MSLIRCRLLFGLCAAVIVASGCDKGATPTAPSPAPSPAPPITSAELVPKALGVGCSLSLDGYQCNAKAFFTLDGSNEQDVTGLSTWSSSDTSIATVNSVGMVNVLRTGDVAIRATYRGVDGFQSFRAEPGGYRAYFRTLSGFVKDAQDGSRLEGVTVLIYAGVNGGRTTTTGRDGVYRFDNLDPGVFSMRFSKPGYASADRAFSLSGDSFNSLDVNLVR